MASSLLALLDDITTLLDDVAVLSKVAVKKSSGVLGDDLALNAEQVTGFRPERELPVVWAVAKGSFLNKLILVPAALAISAFIPVLIGPLLMVGGLFLCFEGVEKVVHKLSPPSTEDPKRAERVKALADPKVNVVAMEAKRIKGAIRTDLILSAEIIVIALGTMATAPFLQRAVALSVIGIGVTVFVYGLVAGIVKLDDLGTLLLRKDGDDAAASTARSIGSGILWVAPHLMRTLSIVGTAAMFLVGGSILVHGVPPVEHALVDVVESAGAFAFPLRLLLEALVGIAAGSVVVGVVWLWGRIRGQERDAH